MIKINLLAEKKAVRAHTPRISFDASFNAQMFLMAGALGVALLYVGWQWRSLGSEASQLAVEIIEGEKEAKRLEGVNKTGEELNAKRVELQDKVTLITDLKNNQSGPVHLLDQVSLNLPDFVWLDNLNTRGGTLSITGRATTYNAVSNFYNNLTESPFFTQVDLGTTSEVGEGVSFSITCAFVPPSSQVAQTPADDAGEKS
ncbi:MAG: PilN domain-containing protein [Acidobacteria bacterium]|nr:PilN domain-containing protein [Acidobacteriota bacterium]